MSPLFNLVISASALIGQVIAQSSQQACTSTADSPLQLHSTGDASNFMGGCTQWQGPIVIAKDASGPIDLQSIQELNGDFTMDSATNVTGLSASKLTTVTGKFTINNVQLLNTVNMPQFQEAGEFSVQGTPNLPGFTFGQGLTKVGKFNLQNTFVTALDGISLLSVSSIYLANNRQLKSATFQVASIAGSINIEGYGDSFAISFPNLQTAQNVTFRACSQIDIPLLVNLTGTLGFYESPIATISAPNLTSTSKQGTVAVNANPSLTNVSFPLLKTISGGFQVQNNSQLTNVSFPSLQTIGGAIDFYGGLDSVSLPALKDCRGGFNIQSNSSKLDCSAFNNNHGESKAIKGVYKCSGNVTTPGNIHTTGGSSSKKGSAISLNIPTNAVLLTVAGLLAGVMGML